MLMCGVDVCVDAAGCFFYDNVLIMIVTHNTHTTQMDVRMFA